MAAATSPRAAAAPAAAWAKPAPAEVRHEGKRRGAPSTRLSPGVSAQGPGVLVVFGWFADCFWDVFGVFLDGFGFIFLSE